MTDAPPGRYLRVLGLALFILVPSFDTVGKYFGPAGIALYSVIGLIAVFAGYFFFLPYFRRGVSERAALILALATLAGLMVVVSIGNPIANSGRFGPGSDVDDAMIMAVGELTRGNYPYYLKTYLGLPISPMPGAIFLGMPWVVAGVPHFQNLFWIAVLFVVIRRFLQSYTSALALFWAVLLLSPTVAQSLVTGSDYIANAIYVLVAAVFMLRYAADAESPVWKKLLPAAFLGLALSSRSNFMLVLPISFLTLVRTAGWKEAIRCSAVAAAVFAAVTLPFWAYDPAGFSPLTAQSSKFKLIDQVLPFAGVIIPVSALVIGVALSLKKNAADAGAYLVSNGILQLYLVLFTSIVYAVQMDQLNLYMASSGYGLFALFFGAAGCWLLLNEEQVAATEPQPGLPMQPQPD